MTDAEKEWEIQCSKLTEVYLRGVKRLCFAHTWIEITKHLEHTYPLLAGADDIDVAEALRLSRHQIGRCRKGGMKSSVLFALMTELRLDYDDLGELPTREQRALAGYLSALHSKVNSQAEDISPEVFIALASLSANSAFRSGRRGAIDWRAVYSEVILHLEGRRMLDPFGTLSEFRRHVSALLPAVFECMDQIKYSWLEDGHNG